MVREVVVLSRQQGMDEVLGDVAETDRRPAHLAKFCYQFVITAVDAQGHLQAHVAQRLDRGQVGAEIQVGAAETEQQATEDGDAGPPQKLQQTHGMIWISREKKELDERRGDKGECWSHYKQFLRWLAICVPVKCGI
ncbi:hypothetical protein D9M73_156940 [compost metagenome]